MLKGATNMVQNNAEKKREKEFFFNFNLITPLVIVNDHIYLRKINTHFAMRFNFLLIVIVDFDSQT